MVYQLIIPAQFAAAFASGQIGLMATAAGATTTLVAAGGQIVGVAALAEVGGTAAAAGAATGAGGAGAAAGGALAAASSVLFPVVIGVAAAALVGAALCWLLEDEEPEPAPTVIEFEATPEEAADVLAQTQAIIDAEYGRLADAPLAQLKEI